MSMFNLLQTSVSTEAEQVFSSIDDADATIGEGAGRNRATNSLPQRKHLKTLLEQLKGKVIAPATSPACVDQAYEHLGLQPTSDRNVTQRCKATHFASGQECWLPAPLTAFAYHLAQNEQMRFPTMSTGLGLDSSLEGAKLAALLEVIKRDCISLAWTWRLPVREIPSSDPVMLKVMEACKLPRHAKLRVFNISIEIGVPVIFAIIEFTIQDIPFVAVGSAADLVAAAAASKAIKEATQGIPYVQFLRKRFISELKNQFIAVTSFEKGAAFYNLYPQRWHALAAEFGDVFNVARFEGLRGVQADSMRTRRGRQKRQLESVLERLFFAGYEAYYMDVTPGKLATANLSVVRALIPRLYTLESNYNLRIKNPLRAQSLAEAGGCGYQYNPYPHPMP